MKVKVLKPCTLTAQPGSIVEVNDGDVKFLRGYVEKVELAKKEEKQVEEPKVEEKPKAKKKAKKGA